MVKLILVLVWCAYLVGLRATRVLKVCSKFASQCVPLIKSKTNLQHVLPFRNAHRGASGLLLGNGPSRDIVDPDGLITFGVNDVFLNKKNLDYLFQIDKGLPGGTGWLANQRASDSYTCLFRKFHGYFPRSPNFGPPRQVAFAANASIIEFAGVPTYKSTPLIKEIGKYQAGGSASSVIHVLQFALYTGLNRLYVSGCDGGSSLGHSKNIIREWIVALVFAQQKYPDVRICYVEPPYALRSFFNGRSLRFAACESGNATCNIVQQITNCFK